MAMQHPRILQFWDDFPKTSHHRGVPAPGTCPGAEGQAPRQGLEGLHTGRAFDGAEVRGGGATAAQLQQGDVSLWYTVCALENHNFSIININKW